MGLWPSQRSTRQVPQDELAVLADGSESQRAVFAPPCVPRDAFDPRGMPLAVRDDVLLERRVHCAEVVLSAGLWSTMPVSGVLETERRE